VPKQLFAIMSPTMGKREDVPSILLEKVFTTDNENSCIRYGEIHRIKMRLKELLTTSADTEVDVESSPGGDNKVLAVTATTDFAIGGEVLVDEGESHEYTYTIDSIDDGVSLTMTEVLAYTHEIGETVTQAELNKIQTPDGYPVLRYHLFVKRQTGTEYLLLFTKKHIYLWTGVLEEKFECSAFCESWEVVSYNDKVVATNNVDPVLVWDDIPGDGFIFLDDPVNGIEYETGVYLTAAKHLIIFENYLILGNTTENAEVHSQRIRWNAIGDEVQWITGTSGSKEVGEADFITGFGICQSYLFIFKKITYYKMWLVPLPLIFNVDLVSNKIGCLSSHSIINDKYGRLFFLASDYTIKEIGYGEISALIDKTIKTITPAYAHLVESTFIDKNGELLWAIPFNSSTNNKVISFKNGKWNEYDLAINSFGDYKRQIAHTWDTLPFDTFDSWGWDKWNVQDPEIGFEIELGADYLGYSYALFDNEKDDEEDYSGFFVLSTDLYNKQGLSFNKRLLDLNIYVRKETKGTLIIEIKRDHESTWQSAGTVGLTGDEEILIKHLPVDYRAKHFLIKISGENRYRFIGIMFSYMVVGER